MSFEFDIIGILGDVHHAGPLAVNRRFAFGASGPRFYDESDADILEATTSFNIDCDCMVQLGDLNDVSDGNVGSNDSDTEAADEGEALLDDVFGTDLENFTGPIYLVKGNWDLYDFDFATPADYYKYVRLGKRSPETIVEISATTYTDKDANAKGADYYMFQCTNGTLGIVLDTTGKSADDPEAYASEDTDKSQTTNWRFVPETQRTWLAAALANHTDSPIVIFTHYWIFPARGGTYYRCGNADAIMTILEDYNAARIAAGHRGRVLACFSGHHHPGTEGWWLDALGMPTQVLPGPFVRIPDEPLAREFGEKKNGIKYFNVRCPIVGWGSDEDGATDDGLGGEATPSNSFYKATVGEFVKGVYDIKVEGFGHNPIGESKSSKQYIILAEKG